MAQPSMLQEFNPSLLDASSKTNDRASREVSPNRGASVKDIEATGPEQEALGVWRTREGIDPENQIKIVKVAHMRYRHPDLEEITTFMRDFGMTIAKKADDKIWFKGYSDDQYVYYAEKGEKEFLGATFTVESYEDLEKAQKLAGGRIEEMKESPGGGHILIMKDPEGFAVNLMYGQEPGERGEAPPNLLVNSENQKPRKREFQRFTPGPAAVHKLGHFGFCVQNLSAQIEWYTRNFNFAPTDFLYVPGEDGTRKNVGIFMHVDRGQELVDHHTFFMTSNKTSHVHHCSFEVHDFDTQNLGHQWLAKKGYNSVWGIGRHILGSQIFDYWWDTTGFMVEHYADGDLVNEDTPIGYGPAGDESLAVWGPEVPKTFLE